MVDKINLFAQPIRKDQQAAQPAVNNVAAFQAKAAQQQQGPSFGSMVKKVGVNPLAQKYGPSKLDAATVQGSKEKHMAGRSMLGEGALGKEGAVNGKLGARLNLFA